MPFIITARPEDLDRGPGAALASLGKNVLDVGQKLHAMRAQAEARAKQEKLAAKRLELEEMRAEQSLLRDQAAAADRAKRAGERSAAVEGITGDLAKLQGEQETEAFQGAFGAEANRTGGLLGPYGSVNPRAVAAGGMALQKMQQEHAIDMEKAKRMQPTDAAAFLARRHKEQRVGVIAEGYAEEKRAIQKALQDGEFEPPEVVFAQGDRSKATEPTEGALAEAQRHSETLQQAIKSGRAPGDVHKRLAERAEKNHQLRMRAAAWQDADLKAQELLGGLQELSVKAGGDQAIVDALAKARGEWTRTQSQSYRRETDPEKQLGVLQSLLFGTKATQDPTGFVAEEGRRQSQERIQRTQGRSPLAPEDQRGQPMGNTGFAFSGAPEAPGSAQGGLTAEGLQTASPGYAASGTSRGVLQGARPAPMRPKGGAETQIRTYVAENAQTALSSKDPVQGALGLLRGLAKTLGRDPNDPDLVAAVADELQRFKRGGGTGAGKR